MKPVFDPKSIWSLFSEGSRGDYDGKTFQEFGEEILPVCYRIMAEKMDFAGSENEFPRYLRQLFIEEIKNFAPSRAQERPSEAS